MKANTPILPGSYEYDFLAMAGKAYGSIEYSENASVFIESIPGSKVGLLWNPMADDRAAFRLMARLRLGLDLSRSGMVTVLSQYGQFSCCVSDGDQQDICRVIRKLIVEMAAEIGRGMNASIH